MAAGTAKVLVVDDDPFMRELLTALLEEQGYAVGGAADGSEALAVVHADTGIGLVITDLHMPDMSGLELIKRIREEGSEMPAILLTGDADRLPAVDGPGGGTCAILIKDERVQETLGPLAASALEAHERLKRARGEWPGQTAGTDGACR